MSLSREELEAKLLDYVGREIGPPEQGPYPVNETMIRQWCEALGDENPVYTDASAATSSVHGGLVAPPTMMQTWSLRGVEMADPDTGRQNLQTELHSLLAGAGYPAVVATNCEQGYTRYLRPGDEIFVTTTIESISEQKATALGIGYFINTREVYRDQQGDEVGWQTFRVLKFARAEQPGAATSDGAADEESSTPTRLRPPMAHDNKWWWDGIAEGRLLVQKCAGCGELRHPPRPMCQHCRSLEWEGIEASGEGEVYSYVVMHYPKFPGYEYPFSCALVELAEGTRMVANVVGCDPSKVHIGMKVRASIENVDDEFKLPFFRPID